MYRPYSTVAIASGSKYRTHGHGSGLPVITLTGPRVSAMTMFTPDTLARFGLPRTLPA